MGLKCVMYKIQIVHIITDLGTGGAESILFHLLKATYKQTDCIVISLKSGGFYKSKIELLGVPVYELNMFGLGSSLLAFIKLYRILSLHRNSVVQTWLYHADFMGGVVAKLVGVKKIIWGIHNTTLMPGKTKFFTRLLVKLLSKLSWFIPDKIVCCANLAAEIHVKQGYSRKKNSGYS